MIDVRDVLLGLVEQGASFWLDGDKLKFNAPAGVMTDEAKARLKTEKDRVMALLREEPRDFLPALPLSYQQRTHWFIKQTEPDTHAYNVLYNGRFHSPLDLAAFRRVFQRLVDRHPSFRTVYTLRNGVPLQQVLPKAEIDFFTIDASDQSPEQIQRAMDLEFKKPFDLTRAPLLRVHVWSRSLTDHFFLFAFHHIAGDGWSLWMLIDEIRKLYQEEAQGVAANLPPLKNDYVDYARWQQKLLDGPGGEALWAYWQKALSGAQFVLDLPTDHPRPPKFDSAKGDSLFFSMDDLLPGLNALAQEKGTTLYVVMLAAFQSLLHRYSGQQDLLVGTPAIGRQEAAFAPVVGDMRNMIVMRGDFANDPTFAEMIERVKQVTLQGLANQDYPFMSLVEKLRLPRDPSRMSLFQVVFILQRQQASADMFAGIVPGMAPRVDFGGLQFEPLLMPQAEGQFDLTIEAMQSGASLFGTLRYNTTLFERPTIDRLKDHYRNFLASVVADPNQKVADVPLLSASERSLLLKGFNQTAASYPRTVVSEWVEQQAERTPDALALADGEHRYSYAQLNTRANQLADHLISLGVGPDTMVGLCTTRSWDMVVAMLAIMKAGAAFVPLDSQHPPQRIAMMLEDTEAPVVVVQRGLVNNLPPTSAKLLLVDDEANYQNRSDRNPKQRAGMHNLAYVMFTSGSTGRPKGTMIEHQNLSNFVAWYVGYFELGPQDRSGQQISMGFDLSITELWPQLSSGSSVWIVDDDTRASPQKLRDFIVDNDITVTLLATTMSERVLALDWPQSKFRAMIAGGSALSLYPRPGSHPFRYFDGYGPTETTVLSTCGLVPAVAPDAPQPERPPSIGKPLANTQIYILDARLQPTPIGVPGQLFIGGDGVTRGYLKNPERTAAAFISDPFASAPARMYATGDVARWAPDGTIEYLGRNDDQVKVRGFRIELGEVQVALAKHPGLKEVSIKARDDRGEKVIVAYVIAKEAPPTISELREFLKDHLPGYMIPSYFIFMDAFPLNASGKVDSKRLPGISESVQQREHVAPRNTIELELTKLWASILKVEPVGAKDEFFELGGHSLLLVNLLGQIEVKFGINIPLAAVQNAATVEKMAELIQRGPDAIDDQPLVPIQTKGTKKPLFMVHALGGDVTSYVEISRGLGNDQPFYGIQSPRPTESSPKGLRELATRYIQAIKEVQPEGPYLIGAYCMGGFFAYEMARQLHEANEKVERLILLDSWLPPATVGMMAVADEGSGIDARTAMEGVEDTMVIPILLQDLQVRSGHPLLKPKQDLMSLTPEGRVDYVLEQARALKIVPAGGDAGRSQVTRLVEICRVNFASVFTGALKPGSCPLTLFRALEPLDVDVIRSVLPETFGALVADALAERALGWASIHQEEVQVIDIPGNHYTIINKPNVAVLAERLRAVLDAAQS